MRLDGKATYWGKDLNDTIDEKTRKLLGLNLELHQQGKREEDTKTNNEALDIIKDHTNGWLNARQVLFKHNAARIRDQPAISHEEADRHPHAGQG